MERSSQILLNFLLDALVQVAVVALIALACDRLLRGMNSLRHVLWVSALAFSLLLPGWTASFSGSETEQTGPAVVVSVLGKMQRSEQTDAQPVQVLHRAPLMEKLKAAARRMRVVGVPRWMGNAILLTYLFFLVCRLGWLLRAWVGAHAIAKRAKEPAWTDRVHGIVDDVANEFRFGSHAGRVRLLASPDLALPVTLGGVSPCIVMPQGLLDEGDTEMLRAAIGHELAHVQQRDYLFNLLYELLYLPISFHPAAAMVRRHIHQTRELRCDELVTRHLLPTEAYARSLVRLVAMAVPRVRTFTPATLGITDGDILEERVMTILQRPQIRASRRVLFATTAILLFVLPAAAVSRLAFNAGISKAVVAPPTQALQAATQAPQEASPNIGVTEKHDDTVKVRVRTPGDVTEVYVPEARMAQIERDREVLAQDEEGQDKVTLTVEQQDKAAREKAEMDERGRRERVEFDAMTPEQREAFMKERQKQYALRRAELLKQAKVTMQQAMEIALREQPGALIGCNLTRERDTAMYVAEIVSGAEDDPKTTRLLIDAGSGQVVSKFDELPRVRR